MFPDRHPITVSVCIEIIFGSKQTKSLRPVWPPVLVIVFGRLCLLLRSRTAQLEGSEVPSLLAIIS